MPTSRKLPLIYSCSGCSNIAQLANSIALEFDKKGIAEMSCIAGVGGGVPSLVNKANSGRKIIALDGCHLHCCKHCLNQHGILADLHFTLTQFGLKKQYHRLFGKNDIAAIAQEITAIVAKEI